MAIRTIQVVIVHGQGKTVNMKEKQGTNRNHTKNTIKGKYPDPVDDFRQKIELGRIHRLSKSKSKVGINTIIVVREKKWRRD